MIRGIDKSKKGYEFDKPLDKQSHNIILFYYVFNVN